MMASKIAISNGADPASRWNAGEEARRRFKRTGLIALLTLVVLAGLMWKSPDSLTVPQFWAEDAVIFFAQQWGHAGPQLTNTYAGYLHTLPRLVAWLGSMSSPGHAPFLYNLLTLLIAVASVIYFLLRLRMRPLIMIALAGILIAPTNGEVFGTLTNVQWFTQFLLLAGAFLPPARTALAPRIAMPFIVLLAALTGPFSTLLLGVHIGALLLGMLGISWLGWLSGYLRGLDRWRIAALWIGGLLQFWMFLHADEQGIANTDFVQIIEKMGAATQVHTFGVQVAPSILFLALLTILPAGVLLSRIPGQLKGMLLVGWALALMEIATGAMKPGMSIAIGAGDRYFVLFKPLLWMLLYLAGRVAVTRLRIDSRWVLALVAFLLSIIAWTQRDHLRRSPLPDLEWETSAKTLEGNHIAVIPINPVSWKVRLPPATPTRFLDGPTTWLRNGIRAVSLLPNGGLLLPRRIAVLSPAGTGSSSALALPPQGHAILAWQVPRAGVIDGIAIFLGNYHGKADGLLHVRTCVAAHCSYGQARLSSSRDNDFLEVDLADALMAKKGQPLSAQIWSSEATHPVAFWTYPGTPGDLRLESIDGSSVASLADRTIRIQLFYHD